MFIKGSRYRNLPESTALDADGERSLGKDLRVIPEPLAWPFRHTVREGDRLDLLSFKYHTEPTRWWQISDANPQEPFPTDLLDRRPIVRERFVLRNPDFETRFRDLVIALGAIGQVDTPVISSFEGKKPVDPGFVDTTVVVTYAPSPATHQAIVDAIEAVGTGFTFLRSFAWATAPDTSEAFTFDDPLTRDRWRNVVETLSGMGVIELESTVMDSALDLTYNSVSIPRESILNVFEVNGFSLQPETTAFATVGSKIVIPPNQVV